MDRLTLGAPVTADTPSPIAFDRSRAALAAEYEALLPALEALDDNAWSSGTRLPAWNVRQLLVHLTRAYDRVVSYLRAPEPPRAEVDANGYWRAAMAGPEGSDAVAARTIDQAGDRSVSDILGAYRGAAAGAAELAGDAGPGRVIASPFGGIRLDHYLVTRVVEATVHGLDLRAGVGLEEVATPLGLDITAAALDALYGAPRPVDLERDDLAWILAATGRVANVEADLPVLA